MPHTKDTESRRRLVEFAEANGGALSRKQARTLGVAARSLRSEIDRGRLLAAGRALRVVGAPPDTRARWVMALANSSPTCALDGVTSLNAWGLEHFDDVAIHLGGPQGARVDRSPDVRFHCQRRWLAEDVVELHGLRCIRPDVAAVNAALWLPTVRAASTLLAMTCQQDVCDPKELLLVARRLPGRLRRSKDVLAVIDEICGGSESINELDFARACRRHGLPEPDRQQALRSPSGLWYLDVEFTKYGVHVEIHGVHHRRPDRAYQDDLKSNEVAISDGLSLRVPSSAIRDEEDAPYEQLARALRKNGWPG